MCVLGRGGRHEVVYGAGIGESELDIFGLMSISLSSQPSIQGTLDAIPYFPQA